VAPLAACRPGEERADEPGYAGGGAMGGDRVPVAQEPDVAPERVRSGLRLAREREDGRHRKHERDARHAPWLPCSTAVSCAVWPAMENGIGRAARTLDSSAVLRVRVRADDDDGTRRMVGDAAGRRSQEGFLDGAAP